MTAISSRLFDLVMRFTRALTLLFPPRFTQAVFRLTWPLDPVIQQKLLRTAFFPLLEWRPHYLECYLQGSNPRNDELESVWIGEGIRDKGLDTEWENVDRVVLYIHGGSFHVGYSSMFLEVHLDWIRKLKTSHGLTGRILSVGYSLSPLAKHPKAVQEISHSYAYLLSLVPSDRITVSGDSAGGFLALSFLRSLDSRHPLPAGLLAISPVVTFTSVHASLRTNEAHDILPPNINDQITQVYVPHDVAVTDPRLSMIDAAPFDWLPANVMVVVGWNEILRDSIMEFVERARKDGRSIELLVGEGEVHDWVLFPMFVSAREFKKATNEIVRFIARVGA